MPARNPPAQRQNSLGAAVAPDGRYIYYARRNGTFTYNANFPLWQIVRKDRDTGEECSQIFEFAMHRSPDSRFIGYSTRSKLMKVAASGGPPQTLCMFSGGGVKCVVV